MTKASDNAFPSILITEGTEPSAPAAGKQRLYIDSTTHKLKRTDSSGTDVTIESTGGSVATDAIFDARGDLAVGTGSDTAAKLTVGANGTLVVADSAQSTGLKYAIGQTFHGVRAVQSANTALTSGSVVYVAFDGTDDYDTDGYHDPASNNTRLTVPSGLGGYYRITGYSLLTTSVGSSYCVIRKNGTTLVASGVVYDVTSGAGSALATCTLSLAATDYVEFGIKVGASSKNSTDAGVVEPAFEMSLIGI